MEWFENSLEKWGKMVWLCEFRGGINDWDLKILYRDLESWKNYWKKMEWNGMVWKIRKLNGLE